MSDQLKAILHDIKPRLRKLPKVEGQKPIWTLPTEVPGSSLGKRGGLGKVRSKSLSLMIL